MGPAAHSTLATPEAPVRRNSPDADLRLQVYLERILDHRKCPEYTRTSRQYSPAAERHQSSRAHAYVRLLQHKGQQEEGAIRHDVPGGGAQIKRDHIQAQNT